MFINKKVLPLHHINNLKTNNMKTVTGKTIKVNANTSLRTFTIRTNGSKYRTNKMSKSEFMSNENNTGNDWQSFLNGSNDYYLVK